MARSRNYFYGPHEQLHPVMMPDQDMSAQVAKANLQLCEMQAQIDELIAANLRLRRELGEVTLALFVERRQSG